MTTTTIIVLVIVGALIAYKIGSIALRVLGGLMFILGLLNLIIPDTNGIGGASRFGEAVFAFVGVVLWLAGHWLFALRHHIYRSTLAQRVFVTMLPDFMDPTRKWGVKTVGQARQ